MTCEDYDVSPSLTGTVYSPSIFSPCHLLSSLSPYPNLNTLFPHLQPDAAECIADLKKQGYRILVSDIHESSKSVHDFDWAQQKTAIIMGNEVLNRSDLVCSGRYYILSFFEATWVLLVKLLQYAVDSSYFEKIASITSSTRLKLIDTLL
jgi:hypothetical protein